MKTYGTRLNADERGFASQTSGNIRPRPFSSASLSPAEPDNPAPLLRMPVDGRSMWPTLQPGDALWVQLAPARLRAGDIALFRKGNELFAHRFLISRQRNRQRFLLAKGDGHWGFDPLWPEHTFFGVAVTLERDGISHSLAETPLWRRWGSVGVGLAQGAIAHLRYHFLIFALLFFVLATVAEASVTLTSFTATLQDTTSVRVQWQTASEVNALGFNLYRSVLPGGTETLLNSEIIPAEGSIIGSTYQFLDEQPPAAAGYQYRLEEISSDGGTESFGPVVIYRATPTPTITPTATRQPPTATPTPTASPTLRPTATPSPTTGPTSTPSFTPIPSATTIGTIRPTSTPSSVPTTSALATTVSTATPIPPATATAVPPTAAVFSPTPVTELPILPTATPPSLIDPPDLSSDPLAAPTTIPDPSSEQLSPTSAAPTSTATPLLSAAAATFTPIPIRFAEALVGSADQSTPRSERLPNQVFALIGIISLVGAGIIGATLLYLRSRWGR